MREIAAASDFDFVASEPAPLQRKPRVRAKPAAKAVRAPLWLSRAWAWRTPLFGGLAFITLLAAIGINAMFLQHGRHPAPLMGSVLRIESPKPEPAHVKTSPAPSALDQALAPTPLAAPTPAEDAAQALPAPTPAAHAQKPVEHAAKPAQAADPIGVLIERSDNAVPAKKVAAAQKALNKLGLHVPANGRFDAATRKAVEKFQHDNGLPITGELTPKLRRYLALQAGLPAE